MENRVEWIKAGWVLLFVFALTLFFVACSTERKENSLVVTATAYTSRKIETDADPAIAAWGDRLRPGMKAIAVSHDLIPLGLIKGAKVRIKGLRGEYVVLDKMDKRWKKRIDLYLGNDVEAAKKWGMRKVTIYWKKQEG